MNSLILINETFTNGYRAESIYIISLASVLSGIFVIISKNPIVSVLFLIGLFLSIACYLLVLGINFIGLSYLLVYVGAVSILFLFILMLINVRISELLNDTSNSIPLALVIAISFNYPVYQTLPINLLNVNGYSANLNSNLTDYLSDFTVRGYSADYLSRFFNFFNNDDKIFFVTSKFWDGSLAETTHITSIGNIMYTSYSIWLIITSIILLLAMVGAIVITIKQKD
uniref:NADH-ubiquinone oxidoreductase chain 6 n=1 Tax=Lepraria oxybapha TaxID=1225178 RepID=A0A290YM36_9LECA|nr:NADH dehydrogenase subunit 6 [Lepraria oxybapha]